MIVKVLLAAASALLLMQPARAQGSEPACLQLVQGWVRAPVAGRTMTAGYGQLYNRCQQPARVAGLSSPQAAMVELHRSELVDGISRMRPAAGLVIAPGTYVVLQPGGLHLMLHGTDAALAEGSELLLQLADADGRVAEMLLPVRRTPPAGG